MTAPEITSAALCVMTNDGQQVIYGVDEPELGKLRAGLLASPEIAVTCGVEGEVVVTLSRTVSASLFRRILARACRTFAAACMMTLLWCWALTPYSFPWRVAVAIILTALVLLGVAERLRPFGPVGDRDPGHRTSPK